MLSLNSDRLLQMTTGTFASLASRKFQNFPNDKWQPGKPLRLLLAGYNGTRNTGSDVRVQEMIRQFRHLFSDGHLDLHVLTVDPDLTTGYFSPAKQIRLPKIFPMFLYQECPKHHGVVACEGSMFKSKFTDSLTVMMSGALGIAAGEKKLSIGYGAEAGPMSASLKSFVAELCKDSLVICRNESSRSLLSEMGIRSTGGTDTAWTFETPPHLGEDLLRSAGWDGKTPVLGICPIDPFCWPVKPSVLKAAVHAVTGRYAHDHYGSIYFHTRGQDKIMQFERYISGLAQAITAYQQRHNVFPILIGMERLDRSACESLATRMPKRPPIFVSDDHDMFSLVSLLRKCSLLVTSRFHAMVCSMPVRVPSIGVTMDERLSNLMTGRGHGELLLKVDDPDLGDHLGAALEQLTDNQERISLEIGESVTRHLEQMGEMGKAFVAEVKRVYPEFPVRDFNASWEAYVPPLSSNLQTLLSGRA